MRQGDVGECCMPHFPIFLANELVVNIGFLLHIKSTWMSSTYDVFEPAFIC
jgi:hypothetical protein